MFKISNQLIGMVRLCIVCFLLTISLIINLKTVSCDLLPCFDYIIGKKLSITPVKTLSDIGLETCFNQCVAHADCLSVNYNRHEFICQLINRKKNNNETLLEDWNFIHKELPDIGHQSEKICGAIACNNYSTCLHTSNGKDLCIATDCSEPLPTLKSGIVTDRTNSPILASYGCIPGYTAVGSQNNITCPPGGKWTALSYRCESPVNGGWGPWENWSSCFSNNCVSGERSKKRVCNNPYPKYGGTLCIGSTTATVSCKPCNNGGGVGRRKK